MQLKKEVEICIKKTSEKTANEVIELLKEQRLLKTEMSFYKKTEIILYNYLKLKLAIKQKEEDIKYIEQNGLPERSKSIVFYSTARGNINFGDRYIELVEKYKLEKAETERDLARIENALDKVKDDKYYNIIKMKYFEGMKEEDIAEKIKRDVSTVNRNKKRLINAIKIILFPESIKEYM